MYKDYVDFVANLVNIAIGIKLHMMGYFGSSVGSMLVLLFTVVMSVGNGLLIVLPEYLNAKFTKVKSQKRSIVKILLLIFVYLPLVIPSIIFIFDLSTKVHWLLFIWECIVTISSLPIVKIMLKHVKESLSFNEIKSKLLDEIGGTNKELIAFL